MDKVILLLLTAIFLQSCEKEEPVTMTIKDGVLYYSSKETSAGTWQIYKKDLETNIIDTITNNIEFNYWWVTASPDKSKLLLLRSPASSPVDQFNYSECEMIKCNADGNDHQIIIADNQYDWFAFGNPHWHPDGDRILMIAQAENTTAPFFTYTVDVDGNNPQQITNQYSIDANWNSNGDKIVFVGIDEAGFVDATSFEIFTADYDYSSNEISSIIQLTSDNKRNHDPCFSPDGSLIAFSSSNASLTNADLVTIDLQGSDRTDLINDNGIHGGPLNWGTDGKIYHHSIYIGSTNFTAVAFNTNTNNREVLLESASSAFISPFYVKI